jgi:hypothetical protein
MRVVSTSKKRSVLRLSGVTTLMAMSAVGLVDCHPNVSHSGISPNFTIQDGAPYFSTTIVGMGTDASGNVLVAGGIGCLSCSGATFDGTALPGPSISIFVTRYNSSGARQSTHFSDNTTLGFPGSTEVTAAAFDSTGNIYLAGYYVTGYYLAKLDASGARLWTVTGGPMSQSDLVNGVTGVTSHPQVAADGAGNAYVTGRDTSGAFFLTKFSSSGAKAWTYVEKIPVPGNNIDATTADIAVSVAGDAGTTFVIGSQASGVTVDAAGNAYVVGAASSVIQTTSSAKGVPVGSFLAKIDSNGIKQWMPFDHSQAGPAVIQPYAWATSIGMNAAGDIYVAGSVNGDNQSDRQTVQFDGQTVGNAATSYFVSKYDSAGTRAWTVVDGSSTGSHTLARSVSVDSAGNAYLTGGTDGSLDGLPSLGSMFVAKYNPTGARGWSTVDQGKGNLDMYLVGDNLGYTEGTCTAVDAQGKLYVGGLTTGNLDGQKQLGLTGSDYFVSQYN